MGLCVLKEWVVGGRVLDGYFGEQELPVGIQEYLERYQPAVCSKLGQPEWLRRIGSDAYNISVGGTCRRSRVALCGLDVRR